MPNIKVLEDLDVIIEEHPHSDFFKNKLIEECNAADRVKGHTNLVGGKFHAGKTPDSPSRQIEKWIASIIKKTYNVEKNKSFSMKASMWFAGYDKGHYADSHHHLPYSLFSFVYYINAPEGSSDLVFTTSNIKIEAVEGRAVIFPSYLRHHVLQNKSNGRLVLAGNMVSFKNKK